MFHALKPFLSALQNMGVEILHGEENFHQGKISFVQAVYDFLYVGRILDQIFKQQ